MEGEISDSGSTETSKYNEAQLQIQRLHNLWVDFKRYFRENDFYYVDKTLENIWIELYPDAKKKKGKPYFDYIDRINIAIKEAKNNQFLLEFLKIKATFLKSLQDAVGKGGVYEDRSESDFE